MNAPDKRGALLVLLPLCLAACAGAGPSGSFPPAVQESDPEYLIGSPDLIRVIVWKHPELSIEMPVREDGKISVPLLDDIQAAGLTPMELKEVIRTGLSRNISRPNVTVAVISPDSQVVSVLGGVVRAGPVPLRKDMGVLEAVAAAGGFTAWANRNDVRVVRLVESGRVTHHFSYRSFLSGDPDADILLRRGDLIVVPE